MEAKAFAVGVRIEHSQALINKAQYGPFAAHPKLGLLTMPSSIMTRPAGLFIPSACARAAKSLPPALR